MKKSCKYCVHCKKATKKELKYHEERLFNSYEKYTRCICKIPFVKDMRDMPIPLNYEAEKCKYYFEIPKTIRFFEKKLK